MSSTPVSQPSRVLQYLTSSPVRPNRWRQVQAQGRDHDSAGYSLAKNGNRNSPPAYLWLRVVNDSQARVLLVQADTSFEPSAPLIARALTSIRTRHDHPGLRHFKDGPGGMECCIGTPTGHIEWCQGLAIRDFRDWQRTFRPALGWILLGQGDLCVEPS